MRQTHRVTCRHLHRLAGRFYAVPRPRQGAVCKHLQQLQPPLFAGLAGGQEPAAFRGGAAAFGTCTQPPV